MQMTKPSKKMIKALKNADSYKNRVSESTIMGIMPDSPDSGKQSVSLITMNCKSEMTLMLFTSAAEVTEFCAALQAASDAIFGDGDGDMQPVVEFPN